MTVLLPVDENVYRENNSILKLSRCNRIPEQGSRNARGENNIPSGLDGLADPIACGHAMRGMHSAVLRGKPPPDSDSDDPASPFTQIGAAAGQCPLPGLRVRRVLRV